MAFATVQWDARYDGYLPCSLHVRRAAAAKRADEMNGGRHPLDRFFVTHMSTSDALRLAWRMAAMRFLLGVHKRLRGDL